MPHIQEWILALERLKKWDDCGMNPGAIPIPGANQIPARCLCLASSLGALLLIETSPLVKSLGSMSTVPDPTSYKSSKNVLGTLELDGVHGVDVDTVYEHGSHTHQTTQQPA